MFLQFCVCCLVAGSAGLRLLKVEIPAYKFRGESALLECLYELDGGKSGALDRGELLSQYHHRSRIRRQSRAMGEEGGGGGGGEEENDEVDDDFKYAKRKQKKSHRYYRHFEETETDEDLPGQDEDNEEEVGEDEVVEETDNDGNQRDTESLYSVKWYKDNEEFYRYVPKANPPQNSYKVEGIRVDVSELEGLSLNF